MWIAFKATARPRCLKASGTYNGPRYGGRRMSDIIEGLGTATEGGLLSRAIEPGSGAKKKHPHQPAECANCGSELVGAYCHACGQSGHVHRTLGGFMHDLLHGALHFEGKLWRTLPMLVFRPGSLTRRYVDGQRARFVSPMALFLFSVFLMFAVFQMVGISAPTTIDPPDLDEMVAEVQEQSQQQREVLTADLQAMESDDPNRAEAASHLEELDATVADLGRISDAARDLELNFTGIEAIDKGLIRKWQENPGLMLYKLQANAYKFSWLLIPISIPFVWLLFAWKRRFKAYDHAIFVTYSLSFMTLLFILTSVLGKAGVALPLLLVAVALIPPIHIYKQLRGAYELSRFSAFWRLIALSILIWIIVILFLEALLLLGAF